MKKILILWVIMSSLILLSCAKKESKLKIGIIKPSIDHLPLTYALSEQMISKEDTEIIMFNSGWEAQEAMVSGQIDISIMPFTYVWTARSKGYPLKTISFFERETDGIVVTSDIKQMKDLNGKKIGVLRASTIDAFLYDLIKKDSLLVETVYFRTPNEMISALKNKDVSGIVTYVPIIQKLSDEFKVIYWFSEQMPEHPCCNLVGTEKALDDKYLQVLALMRALDHSIQSIREKDEKVIQLMMKNYLLSREQSLDALQHSIFKMNLSEKDKAFEEETMKTFLELKYIEQMPKAEDVYEDRLIREL